MKTKKPAAKVKRRPSGSRLARLAVAAFVVYSAVSILSLQAEVRRSESELEALSLKCSEQGADNADLKAQIEQGSDEAYIERTARERLDYAYAYETVFINASGS